jgi:predicted nucleotidyltransferase component of viral defense system
MTEAFLGLSAAERSEALQVAASTSGRPLHVLEKDVWVVWTLSALFESHFGKHLVFKGSTSLSKATFCGANLKRWSSAPRLVLTTSAFSLSTRRRCKDTDTTTQAVSVP